MLLFFLQMRARACICVCVVHWHCTAQLSMFNMEKRYRNKTIIIKSSGVSVAWLIPHYWTTIHITYCIILCDVIYPLSLNGLICLLCVCVISLLCVCVCVCSKPIQPVQLPVRLLYLQ